LWECGRRAQRAVHRARPADPVRHRRDPRAWLAQVEARRALAEENRLTHSCQCSRTRSLSVGMQEGSMIGGRYQLVDRVAEGGLSTVWQGVARASEVFARPVAIKVMKRAFSTVGGPYLSMFLEEARIGATLQHANLIEVLDFIVEASPAGPVYCLVMEWVDGIDLKTLLKVEGQMRRPVSWGVVASVGLRVLRGLAAAHERRLPDMTVSPVIHRDVSPQNILLALN